MRFRSVTMLILLLVLPVVFPAAAMAVAPRISVTPTVHDFGTIETGEKVTVKFVVINAGDAELVIKDVEASCGCTTTVISSRNIAPGGVGEVEAVFSSVGHAGKVSKAVTIVSNDPVEPRKVLTIEGTVTSKAGGELLITPHSLNTGNMAPKASVAYTYELRNGGTSDLTIQQFAATEGVTVEFVVPFVVNPDETREVKFILKPNQVAPMNVTISPKMPEGRFQEMITVWSDSVQRPVQRLVIRGTVVKQ